MVKDESPRVELAVDGEICVGGGQCEMLASETFYVDDESSISRVLGDGRLPLAHAQSVIESCPSGAISIVGSPSAGRK